MKKGEDKNSDDYEIAIACMNKADNDIKTAGIRSAWLLGLFVAIIIALIGVILKDFETGGILVFAIKSTAMVLLLIYSGAIVIYTPRLIAINFAKTISENFEISEIRKNIKESEIILEKLNGHLNSLISFFTLPILLTPHLIMLFIIAEPYLTGFISVFAQHGFSPS